MRKRLLILVLLLTFSAAIVLSDIQCMDDNNNPVDWFVFYKFPSLKYGKEIALQNGKAFMFITNKGLDDGWHFSKQMVDSNDTPIANTLSFLQNKDRNDLLWLVYNDQGDVECETCGHTKGFVAGDSSGGFWLIHSIPHFLENEYPSTGLRYGQSALCISLKQEDLNSIGDFLQYNQPNFQRWNLKENLKVLYPKIAAALHNSTVDVPYSYQMSINSRGGSKFQGFAKSRDFHEDLYQWVARSLKGDFYSETWINEPAVLPSSCDTQYRVMNVLFMKYDKLGLYYSSHKDHSKIAVAVSNSKPWVCIGDINRAKSQEHRGGGTVCLNNKKLWNSYNTLIKTTQECLSKDLHYKYSFII